MSSWSVLAVWAARLWSVRMCVCERKRLMRVRVCLKSTGWLKRAMWLPAVSWRSLLWWKVICFPEERPVPSSPSNTSTTDSRPHHCPVLHPHAHTDTHTRTQGTLIITLIASTVRRMRTEHSSAVFYVFISITCHLCVCVTDFWCKKKINHDDDSLSIALSRNSILTPSAVHFS